MVIAAAAARAEPPAATEEFAVAWPAGGRVRAPMRLVRDQILVEVKVDGRPARAILDSAASVAVLDEGGPLAEALRAGGQAEGTGATSKIRARLGTIDRVEIGALALAHVAAARVPLPQLAALGDDRPALLVGFPLFARAAVRIDFARGEVVLAPTGAKLAARNASPIDLTVEGTRILAPVTLEKEAARVQIDTGSDAPLLLFAPWAKAHGLPGDRPVVERRGHFGAGTEESTEIELTLGRLVLGALQLLQVSTKIVAPPDGGAIAGLLGNGALASCRAVTIDASAGRLYLDPPCRPRPRRPPPRDRSE